MDKKEEVIQILPLKIRNLLAGCDLYFNQLQEIRLRIGRPVVLFSDNKKYFLSEHKGLTTSFQKAYVFTKEDSRQALEYISNYSLYAYEEQLKQGFLTIRGGHRIGITGSVVLERGKIKTLKHISGMNVRIAHQIKGCAMELYQRCQKNGKLLPTLIIAPPGCGKTTLLRDLIRLVSNGGQTVGVVDERSEIGASYQGILQNDLGIFTDVLDGCPKDEGMNMLIRSMAPDVIAVDEVGSREDVDALFFCAYRGCTMLATTHGKSRDSLERNPFMKDIVDKKMFQRYVILDAFGKPGTIKKIVNENGVEIYD